MSNELNRPAFGDQQISAITSRVEKIHRRVCALQAERAKPVEPGSLLPIITFDQLAAQPIRSRLHDVADDIDGLEYAVWCIGETVMLIAGHDGLEKIMSRVWDLENGSRIASWLDHRWDGVTDGVSTWTA